MINKQMNSLKIKFNKKKLYNNNLRTLNQKNINYPKVKINRIIKLNKNRKLFIKKK